MLIKMNLVFMFFLFLNNGSYTKCDKCTIIALFFFSLQDTHAIYSVRTMMTTSRKGKLNKTESRQTSSNKKGLMQLV